MKSLMALTALTFVSSLGQAQVFTYQCESVPGGGQGTTQILEINGGDLKVSSPDEPEGMSFSAVLDPSYKPRTPNKVRFTGRENGNGRSVVLYSKMLLGTRVGYIQIRGSEDGYWSNDYRCEIK